MRITLDLPHDLVAALSRFAETHYPLEFDEAAVVALREYLIGTGDMKPAPVIDEDSDTAGSA